MHGELWAKQLMGTYQRDKKANLKVLSLVKIWDNLSIILNNDSN